MSQTVPNPFRGLVPTNAALNAATIQRRFLLTQFPQFQDLIVTEYNGSNDYASLQFEATKRLTQGLSFTSSYTYAHEREKTAYFAEYNSSGAGAKISERVEWAHQLTKNEAKIFQPENFLKGADGWNPKNAVFDRRQNSPPVFKPVLWDKVFDQSKDRSVLKKWRNWRLKESEKKKSVCENI